MIHLYPWCSIQLEIGSIVVSIKRNTVCEIVQQLGAFILLEDIDETVYRKIRRQRVIRGVKVGNAC